MRESTLFIIALLSIKFGLVILTLFYWNEGVFYKGQIEQKSIEVRDSTYKALYEIEHIAKIDSNTYNLTIKITPLS